MSHNPKNNANNNNNNKMYTSTPLRSKARCQNNVNNGMQYNMRCTDDDTTTNTAYNKKYYSIPMTTYNANTSNISEMNEFQSLPVDTYNSTMPELLNENELELVIDTDTEESCTNYKTPDTTFVKSNFCHPLYFDNATNSNQSTSIVNARNDTEYIEYNLNEYSKPGTSSAFCETSTINSKNKKFIMENSRDIDYKDLEYYRGRARQEFMQENEDDFPPKLMPNVNKDPYYNNNPNWDPNFDKKIKPHISMETYPSTFRKQRLVPPINVPLIKEDDYQQIPQFLHDNSRDSSQISSCSNDPIFLKYSSKEDLAAKSDSINMLSVVISTVMLLASKSQVPQNYVTWTLKYLKCIKNKQGQYPPNIRKLQKMLTLPSGTGQWQCMDFLAGKNPGKRIDLTKKRKK